MQGRTQGVGRILVEREREMLPIWHKSICHKSICKSFFWVSGVGVTKKPGCKSDGPVQGRGQGEAEYC